MQILSATEAISPALARTRLILFSPFRKGRTWKLAATSYHATLSAIFLPLPLLYAVILPKARSLGPTPVVFLAAAILILTLLFLVIFHLCSRLRFVFFDIVLHRGEFVAPAWRKYGPQSRAWTAVKVAIGFILTAILAAPTAAYIRKITALMATIQPGQPPPPQFILSLFAGYALIYLAFGIAFFAGGLLSDFIVPSLALEDTSLSTAFQRFAQLIRQEPGDFLLYTLLKFTLGIVGYIAVLIAFQIVFLVTLLVAAIVFGLLGYVLHLIGIPTALLIGIAVLIGVALYLFLLVYILLLFMGTMLTFLEAYSIFFLAGRYPLLGDLLDRSMPAFPSYPSPSRQF